MRTAFRSASLLASTLSLLSIVAVAAVADAQEITYLRGSATKLGSVGGRSGIALSGEFVANDPVILNQATITIHSLLRELEGGEELVAGLPLTLHVQPGSKLRSARYGTAFGVRPKARIDIPANRTIPGSFILNLQTADIAFPQLCSTPPGSRTTLETSFTIDDGVNPPIVVEGEVDWNCIGRNPAAPISLKVF
ncbi:MAG TPA: hypothetical protein VEL28_01505 [Candidatus Binatia bacterium]|nr:hypothetical protein [Candidatus Binatia bacterium]